MQTLNDYALDHFAYFKGFEFDSINWYDGEAKIATLFHRYLRCHEVAAEYYYECSKRLFARYGYLVAPHKIVENNKTKMSIRFNSSWPHKSYAGIIFQSFSFDKSIKGTEFWNNLSEEWDFLVVNNNWGDFEKLISDAYYEATGIIA